MSNIPTVQKLMQSLGAIIVSKDLVNKIMPFSVIGDFFNWQEARIKILEERIKIAENRLNEIEYLNYEKKK